MGGHSRGELGGHQGAELCATAAPAPSYLGVQLRMHPGHSCVGATQPHALHLRARANSLTCSIP